MPQDQTRAERRGQFKREFARDLRANATEVERRLWAYLRRKHVSGLRFRRQQPIGPYIVDFFCAAAKLIVELDGEQHGTDEAIAYDVARTEWLESRGYRVVRISNAEFLRDPEEVVNAIWRAVESSGTPLPEIRSRK
jgi:very-short-patch-repair endonuclease